MAGVEQGVPPVHAVIALRHDGVFHQQDGVLGGDADQHDHADHGRHGQIGAGDEQGQDRTGNRKHQRHQNCGRLHPRVEQQHQNDVNAQHAGQHREHETHEQFCHGFGIADRGLDDARGQIRQAGQRVGQFLNLAQRHAVQFDFKIDIAQPVVTVDLCRAAVHRQCRDVGKRHRPARARYGQAFDQTQILPCGFGEFDHDRNLPLGKVEFCEPLIVVTGGRDAQRVGDGGRGHAQIGGAGKVRPHHHFRALQAGSRGDVADAGNAAQFARHLLGVRGERRAVFACQHQDVFFVTAAETDIDARAGNILQRPAQLVLDVLLAQVVALPARGQVEREGGLARFRSSGGYKRIASRRAAADGGIDHAHMRVLADLFARLLGDSQSLAVSAARWQRNVNLGLRQIVRWNEATGNLAGEQWRAGSGTEDDDSKEGRAAILQAPRRQFHVGRDPGRLAIDPGGCLEQISRHHRCQHACHHQGKEHRDRRGPAELHEEASRHAAHERGGQEHRDEGKGGGNHRQADLIGGFHRRAQRRLALAQMAHDVLDLYDGIVNQDAHHQRQRQQGDDIDGETHRMHHGERRNHRQRQRHGGDKRGAPIAQEEPHYQHGQDCAFEHQHHGSLVVVLDWIDKIERLDDGHIRVLSLEYFQRRAHTLRHFDFAGAARARDLEADHGFAIEQRRRAALGHGVAHQCHLIQAHATTIRKRDLHMRKFTCRLHSGNGAH